MAALPVLSPANVLLKPSSASQLQWKPKRFFSEPQPPPQDDGKLVEQALNTRQIIDRKLIKKTPSYSSPLIYGGSSQEPPESSPL